jgi:hypothetical protein
MRLLAQRVPLTLMIDLVAPPNSEELYAVEGASPDRVLASARAAND